MWHLRSASQGENPLRGREADRGDAMGMTQIQAMQELLSEEHERFTPCASVDDGPTQAVERQTERDRVPPNFQRPYAGNRPRHRQRCARPAEVGERIGDKMRVEGRETGDDGAQEGALVPLDAARDDDVRADEAT